MFAQSIKSIIAMDKANRVINQLEADYLIAQEQLEIANATLENQLQYADFAGAFHLLKLGKKGDVSPIRLCNFTAEIDREIIKTDGISTVRHFSITGRLANGEALPTIDVPAVDFDRLEWLSTKWGASTQIVVGSRFRDHVAAAIKERSAPEVVVLTQHTGWTQKDSELIYITASGGVGEHGLNANVASELQGSLADFCLPAPGTVSEFDLLGLLSLFSGLERSGIGLILLGAVMRSTLCHFMPATCSVYLQGTTGTYKSAIAGVLQGFWGEKFDGANLPANWSSTGNALEKIAFLAKDALLVTDDFVARGTRQEVAKMHSNAERLLRAQGNQAGRSRLTSKAELRNAFHPRGIVLATGEDLPNGHSLQARLVYVHIAQGSVDTDVLTKLQSRVRSGNIAQIMSSFIKWLAGEHKSKRLENFLTGFLDTDRHNIGKAGHARTQDNLANLLTGLRVFLDFCEDAAEISSKKLDVFMDAATDTAKVLLEQQAALNHEASDAQRFLELIRAAVSGGKAHLEDSSGGQPYNSFVLGWRTVDTGKYTRIEAMGARIGWVSGDTVYIDPHPCLSIVKTLASALDNHLGSSERAISKSLREAGLLTRCDKGRNTTKVSICGARRNVYAFKMQDIFDLDAQTSVISCLDSDDIPF